MEYQKKKSKKRNKKMKENNKHEIISKKEAKILFKQFMNSCKQ